MLKYLFLLLILTGTASCAQSSKGQKEQTYPDPVEVPPTEEGFKKAYFASGCFWCAESIFESVIGVADVISGYSGGKGDHPTYANYERKGHAEAIEVTYDPKIISFEGLLIAYFGSQNVTQQNGQGPDRGTGYRSIIFFQNEEEKEMIQKKIQEVQREYSEPVAAELQPFLKFWKAEAYHQNFERRNPDHPYIRNISIPRLEDFVKQHPELIKGN